MNHDLFTISYFFDNFPEFGISAFMQPGMVIIKLVCKIIPFGIILQASFDL